MALHHSRPLYRPFLFLLPFVLSRLVTVFLDTTLRTLPMLCLYLLSFGGLLLHHEHLFPTDPCSAAQNNSKHTRMRQLSSLQSAVPREYTFTHHHENNRRKGLSDRPRHSIGHFEFSTFGIPRVPSPSSPCQPSFAIALAPYRFTAGSWHVPGHGSSGGSIRGLQV